MSVVRTGWALSFDVRFKFGPAGPVTDADLAQITGLKDQLDRLPELRAPRRPVLQDMTDRLVRSLALPVTVLGCSAEFAACRTGKSKIEPDPRFRSSAGASMISTFRQSAENMNFPGFRCPSWAFSRSAKRFGNLDLLFRVRRWLLQNLVCIFEIRRSFDCRIWLSVPVPRYLEQGGTER